MDDDGIRYPVLGGIRYEAERVTWNNARQGYIELRRPGCTEPLTRINYRGPALPLEICTYGEPLTMPAVEWLIDRTKWALE
jgi:hypothetical protein